MGDTLPLPRRHLWSESACDDPDAGVGVLGIPFDNAVSFRAGAAFASPNSASGISAWAIYTQVTVTEFM